MTRGTKFLNNSKCNCGRYDRTDRPYGHITQGGALFLKGYCRSCNGRKSLPYTKEQLDLEGDGVKKFFEDVWTKAMKPLGKNVGAKILNDPVKAFQVASQVGASLATENLQAIMNAGLQAGRFVTKGGAVKIRHLTSGEGLFLHPRR